MDSWKEHLAFGLVFEFLFILVMFLWKGWYNFWNTIPILNSILNHLIIIFISPLILDLDHKQGKLREAITFIGLMIGIIGVIGHYVSINLDGLMVTGIIMASAAYLLFYVTVHRGFVHSIPSCLIYSIIAYFIINNIQLSFLAFIGSYTHLIADKIPFKIC